MSKKYMMDVYDVMEELGVSKSKAYKVLRELNLAKYRRQEYIRLMITGELNEYLYEVDQECHARVEKLVEEMKAGAGITEELKKIDQMKWVGLMNNVMSTAEEIVMKEMIII